MFVALLGLSVFSTVVTAADMREPGAIAADTGTELFLAHCARCHGSDGKGQGFDFPALKNSRRLAGDAQKTIAWILTGNRARAGFVTDSSFEMPGFGNLSDGNIAALTQYVRCRFAGCCEAVSPSDVKTVRAQQSPAK